MILEGQGHLGEFNKFPNLSAVPPPSPKRIKLFRNEVQEAEKGSGFGVRGSGFGILLFFGTID